MLNLETIEILKKITGYFRSLFDIIPFKNLEQHLRNVLRKSLHLVFTKEFDSIS